MPSYGCSDVEDGRCTWEYFLSLITTQYTNSGGQPVIIGGTGGRYSISGIVVNDLIAQLSLPAVFQNFPTTRAAVAALNNGTIVAFVTTLDIIVNPLYVSDLFPIFTTANFRQIEVYIACTLGHCSLCSVLIFLGMPFITYTLVSIYSNTARVGYHFKFCDSGFLSIILCTGFHATPIKAEHQ
jgi:hypothetical protein